MAGNYFPMGYGNPVGGVLDAATKGFQLGTAIRQQPEMEARQKEEYASGQRQRERQEAFETYTLMDKQREQNTNTANRQLAYHTNALTAKYGPGGPMEGKPIEDADVEEFADTLGAAGVPISVGSTGFKSDLGTLIGGMSGGGSHYRSPEFSSAANNVFYPSVIHGGAKNDDITGQQVNAVVPGPDGHVYVGLKNTKADGSTYDAPVTLGRTSDEHDPVKPISVEDAVHHTMGLAQVDQQLSNNPVMTKLLAQLHSMTPAEQQAYMMRQAKARAASNRGEFYNPAAEQLALQESQAKVEETKGKAHESQAKAGYYDRKSGSSSGGAVQQKLSAIDDMVDNGEATPEEATKLKKSVVGGAGAGGMGNRAEVYFKRVQAAGNEAAAALANIVELPITTKTLMGGAKTAGSLLSLPFAALQNEVSPQDVQDYDTMTAGVTRNLAAIEASGLAPAGSLTHQMDAVILKPGDSNITKMRRLAEIRQIIEKGLEPNLDDPKVPDEQKQSIRNIITQTQKSVPYTQHDITAFQSAKGKGGTTLADFAKGQGLDKTKEPVTASLLKEYATKHKLTLAMAKKELTDQGFTVQ